MPGSHLLTTEEWAACLPPDGKGQPAGAIPITPKAGSVLLFDRRLRKYLVASQPPELQNQKWVGCVFERLACVLPGHAATGNYSEHTRKGFFIGYAYRWLKNQSGWTADVLPTVPCAVTRQLLNDNFSAQGWFSPTPADAPLFDWLVENGIDPASTGLEGQGAGAVKGVVEDDPISSTNFGRLQGDVGRQSWALWPAMEGGYAGAPAVGKAALEGMSREQLVDFALRLQAQLADG